MEDFELQGRGIQVVEFPCNGGARVRERGPTDSPKGARHPQAPPTMGPSLPGSTPPLPAPKDLPQPGPHRKAAGSFGLGLCTEPHPSGLPPPPLEYSGPLPGPRWARAAAGPGPSSGPPGSGTGGAVSKPHAPPLSPFARALPSACGAHRPHPQPASQTTHPSALHPPVDSHCPQSAPRSMIR